MLKSENRVGFIVGAIGVALVTVDLMRPVVMASNAPSNDYAPKVVQISTQMMYADTPQPIQYVYRLWSDGAIEFRVGTTNSYTEVTWHPWVLLPTN